jgi:hypothetical protein
MLAEGGSTDRVYTDPNSMQTTRNQSVFDCPAAEPEVKQLLTRNQVMLRPRETPSGPGSTLILGRLVNLPHHGVEKSPTAVDSPLTQPVFVALSG